MRRLALLLVVACSTRTRPPPDAALPPAPPPPRTFDLTLHVADGGTVYFDAQLSSNGTLVEGADTMHIDADGIAAQLARLSVTPSIDATLPGALVTLRVAGDLPFELHYPEGAGPSVAMTVERQIEGWGSGISAPGVVNRLGQFCGTVAGVHCAPGLACSLDDQCGHISDPEGVCIVPFHGCEPSSPSVCGCDGRTYASICALGDAHVSLAHAGPC